MAKVAISEFKAKLSHYLRLVKSGEEVEILERGIHIASVVTKKNKNEDLIIRPQKKMSELKKMKFKTKLKNYDLDVVDILMEERRKR